MSTANHRSLIIHLVLAVGGLVCLTVASTFHMDILKVSVDHLVAELGALFLIVGVLHWFHEMAVRKEMLREVSSSVVGSLSLHDAGVVECRTNAREVNDRAHWETAASLTIGFHHSPNVMINFFDILKERCRNGRSTKLMVIDPGCPAADGYSGYPQGTKAKASERVRTLLDMVQEAAGARPDLIRVLFHQRVLRYSFIRTDEHTWIKFFTNSPNRMQVPALKIVAGSRFASFLEDDISLLEKTCRDFPTK
jgi:hypothetical protein